MDEDAGWHRKPIRISVPFHNRTDSPGVEEFYFGDLYHCSLVKVIWGKLTSLEHHVRFHYEPFELWWTPSGSLSSTQVHSELYMSPAFLDAYWVVQEAPNEPGCNLEKVVFAMMFTSDATLLTTFGDAKLWPGYLYCSNDSKYCHCHPSSNCCEHVAYFQTVSTLQPCTLCWSWWWCIVGRSLMHSRTLLHSATEDLTPVRRSWPIAGERRCMHSGISCWTTNSLLHGYMVSSLSIAMESVGDSILGSLHTLLIIWRSEPLTITYYCNSQYTLQSHFGQHQKQRVVSLSTMFDPSIRCTSSWDYFRPWQTQNNDPSEWRNILPLSWHHKRYNIQERICCWGNSGKRILGAHNGNLRSILWDNALLTKVSLQNAFSDKLLPLGFNHFQMFIVDLMHEFELGVWKSLFIHLLRMLDAFDNHLLNELDRRYEQFWLIFLCTHTSIGCVAYQLLTSAYIWKWYHLEILHQCLWVEKISSSQLWRSSTGKLGFYFYFNN